MPMPAAAGLPATLDTRSAELLVEGAVHRWADGARERVPPFIDRHFTLTGSARLHKAALGPDVLRAPVNVALGAATAGARASGALAKVVGARRAGDWLARRSWFLETDVGRELMFRIHDELLHLPAAIGDRTVDRDGLFTALLDDPAVRLRLAVMLEALGQRLDEPGFRERLTETLAAYVGSRTAAAEMAGNLTLVAAGFLAYHQLTPGVVTLAGPVSASLAHAIAVSGFWAGPWAGGVWYGLVGAPAAAPLLTGAVAVGLMAPLAVLTAFAGVVTDPVQRRLGVHRKRLTRMVDTLEQQMAGDDEAYMVIRDHYVARAFDIWDLSAACWRLASR